MTEQDEVNFCKLVEEYVKKHYGFTCTSDFVFDLLEDGTIDEECSIEAAAKMIAEDFGEYQVG